MSQILCWIAATFRMPNRNMVTKSHVDFQVLPPQADGSTRYQIDLKPLSALGDGPGTCWKQLFPSTIIASGFPTPESAGALGLQIDFQTMLEMSEIMCDVNLEGKDGEDAGVYFDGIQYMLYPTKYIEENDIVQWHLERKAKSAEGRTRNKGLAPDAGSAFRWMRISDVEKLAKTRAILGYCGEVEIQLGTRAQVGYHQEPYDSCTDNEASQREIGSDGSLGTTLGIPGFGSIST
jgi:hypothetical protein